MGERKIDQSIGFGVTRNTCSAHSKFSEIAPAEKMVGGTGKLVGECSSNAQIRTLLDEQRQMIIAEYCEKICHHEFQAARAEQERKILQEELWRQQKDFREVHQQNLMKRKELQKFQILPSMSSQDGSSSRTRTLFWNYQEDYKSYNISAAEESEDTLNVFHSHTGYEPNLLTFGELNDSSVPFSFMIPSKDQDVDDVTLGEMLTAGQVDYCVPGGMSVSQSSSVMFDGSGQPDGERMVDRSGQPDVTRNVIEAHSNFLKTPELSTLTIDQGNLMSVAAREHRSGHHMRTKDRRLSRIIAKKSVITNSRQLMPKKSADFYEESYGDRNWNFVKLVNKVFRNGGITKNPEFYIRYDRETKIFREPQNTIMELPGRLQELQHEVNCMNDSKDFQDAESVRSGNSYVTSQPLLFPKHPIP